MGLLQRADEEAARRVHDLSGEDDITLIGYAARGRDLELEPGTGLLCQAVKERFPTTCSDDALDHVGDTMQIERYPGETDDTYRARLSGAFDAHSWAGTAKGIEDQLTAALTAMGAAAPVVTVLEQWQGAYAGADWYSLISVVIQEGPWVRVHAGEDFIAGASLAGGSNATLEEIALIKRIVRKWKDCGAYPARVKVRHLAPCAGIDFIAGTSLATAPDDKFGTSYVTEWIMGRRAGVDFIAGQSAPAAYEI
jgi:hypothetical protein